VKRLWRLALRQGMRRGFDRGLIGGNRGWVVVGGLALLGHLAERAGPREPEVIFSGRLEAGVSLGVTHEAKDRR
jgi:hypothetical protein